MGRPATLGLCLFLCVPAFSCTCVSATYPLADSGASAVFRGTVTEKKVLPSRTEMFGRGRYAITFRIDESWKGPRRRTITIYALEDGADCIGGSNYQVGTHYLVFASERTSQDVSLDGAKIWYGWTDVLPEGTPMLVPAPCAPSGEISQNFVKDTLKRLGKGSPPLEDK